ncbi:MAG: flagellar hook-associated protein FlgL [Geobacteraceae bacterium]|nr:flagellar hook-associated protein FlgL [Geobacteraceae bacterium]
MRVTPGMTANNAMYNLQKGRTILGRLQEQVASGMVINRPSDDPITTRQLLELENKLEEGEQYLSNITKANLWLKMTNTALGGVADVVNQARKLAGTITSGSSDSTVRENAVSQLTELKKQLVDMGNTQFGDQYLFSGFKTDTPPFSNTDNLYHGSGDAIAVEIDRSSISAINITGDSLLMGTGSYGSVHVLQTFDDLISAIQANNPANIRDAALKLDNSIPQISNAISDVSSRLNRLENAKTMISSDKATIQGIISDTQSVDMIEAATKLTLRQTAFEAALSATAKISQLSLLDYM